MERDGWQKRGGFEMGQLALSKGPARMGIGYHGPRAK
jgi:hypothetical protein